jgi:trehalose-6-phosphate synthase/hydroxymethylpyrimidine pyrophosphatase-like HAD family hydrolase
MEQLGRQVIFSPVSDPVQVKQETITSSHEALANFLQEQNNPEIIKGIINTLINNGKYLEVFPHLTSPDIIKYIPPQDRVFDRQKMEEARNDRNKPLGAVTSATNINWQDVLELGSPRYSLNTSKSKVLNDKGQVPPGGLSALVANIDTNTTGIHFSEGSEDILGPASAISRPDVLSKENGKLHSQYMLEIPTEMWNGYNQIVVDFLWNLLHSLEDLTLDGIESIPDLSKAWNEFKEVQKVIANQILAQKENGEFFYTVVQDTYNQVFAVYELKLKGFNQPIHTMHHIPFPKIEYLNSIISKLPPELEPQIKIILKEFFTAFSKYDSVMLQTIADKQKFLDILANFTDLNEEELEIVRKNIFINPATVNIKDIQGKVKSEDFMSEGYLKPLLKLKKGFREAGGKVEQLGNIKHAFVDFGTRVDPIKKIPQKIQNFGQMLESHPDLVGKAILVQQISPSRMDNPIYQREREAILEEARKVNENYPGSVIIINESIPHDEVLAFNVLFNKLGINVTNLTTSIEGMSLSSQEEATVSLAISEKPQIPTVITETAGWGNTLKQEGYPYTVGEDNNMSEVMYQSTVASDEERQQASSIAENWLGQHSWQETQQAVTELPRKRKEMKQIGNVLMNGGFVPATGNFRLNKNGEVEMLVSDFDGTMVGEGGSESDKLKALAEISSQGYNSLERHSLNPVLCSQKTLDQLLQIANVLGQENRFLIAEGGGVIYLGQLDNFQKRILQAKGLYLLQIKDDKVLSRNSNLNPEDYIIKLSPINTGFLSSQLENSRIVNSLNSSPEEFLPVCSNYTNRDEAEKGTSLSNSVICNFPADITSDELNQKRKDLEGMVTRYNFMHKDNPIALRNYNKAGSKDPISSILYPANNEKQDAIRTVKEIIEIFTGKDVNPSFAGNNHNDFGAFDYAIKNGGNAYLNPTVPGLNGIPEYVIVVDEKGPEGFNLISKLCTSSIR